MDALKPGWKNTLASLVYWLFDGYWPAPDPCEEWPEYIEDNRHSYTRPRLLAVGDVADIHVATAADEADVTETLYLLKVSRLPEGRAHLDIERKTLTKLLAAAAIPPTASTCPSWWNRSRRPSGFQNGLTCFGSNRVSSPSNRSTSNIPRLTAGTSPGSANDY